MSATAALILLVEAASGCGPAIPIQLGGGAEVVPAILDIQSQPLDLSAPTPAALSEAIATPPSDVGPDSDSPSIDRADGQCELVTLLIV